MTVMFQMVVTFRKQLASRFSVAVPALLRQHGRVYRVMLPLLCPRSTIIVPTHQVLAAQNAELIVFPISKPLQLPAPVNAYKVRASPCVEG
jgi:hypothetical protein